MPKYTYPSDRDPEFDSIVVPTVDIVRMQHLLNLIATQQSRPVLLIGERCARQTAPAHGGG